MINLIISQLKMSMDWLLQFNDEGLHFIVMFFALVYILLRKEEACHRRLFIGYSLIFTVVYFCPLTSWLITRTIGELVYWRMLWMMPLPVIIAYAMVKLWHRIKKKWIRAAFIGAFTGVMIVLGQFIYVENSPYETRANWEKIPTSPIAICDIVNANRGSEEEWAMLAAPEDMVPYIRVHDASIRQVYGRKGNYWMANKGGKYIESALQSEVTDYQTLCKKCRAIRCNYIVLPDGAGRVEGMAAYHFEVIGRVGSYVVFKDMDWSP